MSDDKDGKRGPYDRPLHIDMPFAEAVEKFSMARPSESAAASEANGPVPLVEDEATGDRFLVYRTDKGAQIDLQVDGDTFWATQQQMSDAFGVTRQNVTMHLQNVFREGELAEDSVCKESLRTGRDGKSYATKLYDLNAFISVGYRVGGPLGTAFRIWATDKLLRYLTKGFVVDSERLKAPGNQDRVAELRDVIRDIRAAEANVYAELRRICAMCRDYDPASPAAHQFYSHMQAKLFWAVTTSTPAMVLRSRADAKAPNMGLQTWAKADVRKAEALVAKNYLQPAELKELNRLTTILLDIFDDQLEIGKLTLMAEAEALLDSQLRNLNRAVLRGGGSVSHDSAEAHAKAQYEKFDEQRRRERAATAAEELAALKAAGRALPKVRGSRKSHNRPTEE
jgi:hypothetical protein